VGESERGGARRAAGRRRRGVMVHSLSPIPHLLRPDSAGRSAVQNGVQPPPTFSLSASSAAWLCTTSRAGKPSVESSCEMSVMSSRGLLASSGRARKALPAVARAISCAAGCGGLPCSLARGIRPGNRLTDPQKSTAGRQATPPPASLKSRGSVRGSANRWGKTGACRHLGAGGSVKMPRDPRAAP
jgi:hypothetical protein